MMKNDVKRRQCNLMVALKIDSNLYTHFSHLNFTGNGEAVATSKDLILICYLFCFCVMLARGWLKGESESGRMREECLIKIPM